MRKLLIILVFALLAGAITYQVLSAQNGYLVFSIGGYVMEATLWGALVILVSTLVLLYLIYKLVQILAFPKHWWRDQAGKKKSRMRDKTAQGVIDYLEGNWPRAVNNLMSGVKHSETPGVNYLGAAAASFNLGDEAECQTLLENAEQAGILDTVAVGLLRTRLHIQNREYEKALAQAELLHRKSPSHPTVLRLLVASRKGIGDWHGLELLLPDLKKHKALAGEEIADLELDVYREIINAFSSTKTANKSLKDQQAELDHLWHSVPNKLKKNGILVAAYVRQLQLLGMPEKAEARLRRFINKHWDDQLAKLYGEIEADASHQLRVAEAWLRTSPDNPYLLETLGRLCVRCELWGKGKEYFEMSLKKNPRAQTYLELGDLLQTMHDTGGSNTCYREGLTRLAGES